MFAMEANMNNAEDVDNRWREAAPDRLVVVKAIRGVSSDERRAGSVAEFAARPVVAQRDLPKSERDPWAFFDTSSEGTECDGCQGKGCLCLCFRRYYSTPVVVVLTLVIGLAVVIFGVV